MYFNSSFVIYLHVNNEELYSSTDLNEEVNDAYHF